MEVTVLFHKSCFFMIIKRLAKIYVYKCQVFYIHPSLFALQVTTGTLPIDDWTQYLEHGDAQIDGTSGWGSIEMRGIEYVSASLLPQ